jgi:hypothetical protein
MNTNMDDSPDIQSTYLKIALVRGMKRVRAGLGCGRQDHVCFVTWGGCPVAGVSVHEPV